MTQLELAEVFSSKVGYERMNRCAFLLRLGRICRAKVRFDKRGQFNSKEDRLKCAILFGAPAGIRTPNQQIMRRVDGHQQGQTKPDVAVFTESAAVKVSYILLRLST